MAKVKLCGLRRKEDILMANELLPDYVGFVFAKSSRQIGIDTALELKNGLNPGICPVGVFVNEYPQVIQALCDSRIIQMVQLHGDESEEYILGLKEKINVPVIKAVRVQDERQIKEAEKLPCDYLLLDTFTRGQQGGSGKTFDWRVIPPLNKPFFLAGGLGADNVRTALSMVAPYAVDVSSAVETDGVKDSRKVQEFIERVRDYE